MKILFSFIVAFAFLYGAERLFNLTPIHSGFFPFAIFTAGASGAGIVGLAFLLLAVIRMIQRLK